MNKTLIGLYIVLALVAGALVGQSIERVQAESNRHAQVYNLCQSSRISDIVTEAECATAQYINGVEYLCKEANQSPANHCWTENNNTLERY